MSIVAFVKGSLLLSIASVVGRLSGVLVLVPLARLLGANQLGIYSLVFFLVQSGSILGRLGVDIAMHRNGAQIYRTDPVATGRLLGVGSVLMGLSFTILTAAVWLLRLPLAGYWLSNKDAAAWFGYAALTLFAEGISSIMMTGLLSLHNFKDHSLSTTAGALSRLLLSPVLAWHYGLAGAFVGLMVGSWLQASVAFFYFRRSIQQHHILLNLKNFRQESYQILRFGVPFYAGSALIGLVSLPMMGEIGRVAGVETLGELRIGQSLSQIVGFLPGAIAPVAVSILSEAHGTQSEDFQRLRSLHLRSNWILALTLAMLLNLTAQSLIGVLFGKEYLGALPLVMGLSWWAALTVVVESVNLYSLTAGNTTAIAVAAVTQKVVFIGFTFGLIPQWQGMAFVSGLLIASGLQLSIMLATIWQGLETLLQRQIGILCLWSVASVSLAYGVEQLHLPTLISWVVTLFLLIAIAVLGILSIVSAEEKSRLWGSRSK